MNKEFETATQRYVPEQVTYNGTSGNLWKIYKFDRNCWVFSGTRFYKRGTTRNQITQGQEQNYGTT